MAVEIERKFLVTDESWRDAVSRSAEMQQGYLNRPETCSVRVRISGDQAMLNIKAAVVGSMRSEFEYPLPLEDARQLLDQLAVGPVVSKIRHWVEVDGMLWEIDEFTGDNQGLIVAEIELDDLAQSFERPSWLGREVTEEQRYYNVSLSRYPYCQWQEHEK